MGNNPSQQQQQPNPQKGSTPTTTTTKPNTINNLSSQIQVSQPVAIHGAASAAQIDNWEDEDDDNLGGGGEKSGQIKLSQSAPVHSNRITKPIPNKPRIKPQSINVPELPDIELPPSYTDPVYTSSNISGSGQMSKSMPVSRSLKQYAISCPPNIHSILQVQIQSQNQTETNQNDYSSASAGVSNSNRSRKDSILDLLVTGSLINEVNHKSGTFNSIDLGGGGSADSDEELPFK